MPHGERRATVLLIDDDPGTRDLLCARLEESGFLVFTARGERDGTEYARAASPQVILLEFGNQNPRDSLDLGRLVKEGARLAAGVPLLVYASREDDVAKEGEVIEVSPREYVALPDDGLALAAVLRGLASLVVSLLLFNLVPSLACCS